MIITHLKLRPARWRSLGAFLAIGLAGCAPPVPPERDLLIATATTGGTFYPVGVAMATIVAREFTGDEKILASAITSSGSAENVAMLERGEVQLAILQALFASMARQGSGIYEKRPVDTLRGVSMLWPNVEQLLVFREYIKSGTVDDIRGMAGERISLGSRWSGTEISARTILSTLGINPGTDFDVAHLEYGPSADAMQNRRIGGMFLAGGIPTGAITQAFAGMGGDTVALLEFTDEHLARLREKYPVWNRFVIPAETYPGQPRAIQTLAQPNVLVTTSDLNENVIYHVLHAIWKNIDFLHRQHAATRRMSLDRSLVSMPLPLHAGAVRFYREAGLTIDDTLIPPEMRTSDNSRVPANQRE